MNDRERSIAIIGGGASGLAAAITAARAGARVVVYEAAERVGNSIKVSGDGRCNIANTSTRPEAYRNPEFAARAFAACSGSDALAFLGSCGLLLREEAQGRLYPQANKSTSVIDALRLAAARAGVREACGMRATRIRSEAGRWRIRFDQGSDAVCDRVIVACGNALSSSLLPSDVPISPFLPILGPLRTDSDPLRGLDRVRVRCALTSGSIRESGEITFRTYGISGIVAFDMSRFVRPGDALSIDLIPQWGAGPSVDRLRDRLDSLASRTWAEFCMGMLLPLVGQAVLRAAGLDPQARPHPEDMPVFDAALRAFPLTVRGIGDERLCQVKRGGVAVEAVDPASMAVRNAPGLLAAGEALDVDGPCGGYNLHWAWISGSIAGRAAAEAPVLPPTDSEGRAL
jgi:predicted Rossmann fold flavoprotein